MVESRKQHGLKVVLIALLSALSPAVVISGCAGAAFTLSTTQASATKKTAPTIQWPTPAAITYGTTLSATQLNATASVPGIFVYSPAAGTTPTVGTDKLTVRFTPSDTAAYTTATLSITLTVNKATPTITWAAPSPINVGTALSTTQLNATAPVGGTFTYTPAKKTIPAAGIDTLSVTFTPSNTSRYNTATAAVSLTVNKLTPTVTWPTPAPILSGTALSATQLDATASVPGTFLYNP